jgi:hypothetical protein
MNNLSNRLRAAAFACALTAATPFAAFADDFVKECTAGNPGPDGEKACNCMSAKVTGPDRAAAIDAMSKTNTAMKKGDTSLLTPEVMKTMATVMSVQADCSM